jgi:LysR family transcriptional regulator, cys regulon transcriptional activator
VRTRNRIIGLTEPGEMVYATARSVCASVNSLHQLKEDMNSGANGVLTIGTTYFQARYVLPRVIQEFVRKYPEVQLEIHQGDPEDIRAMAEAGEVDVALGTETAQAYPGLITLDCFEVKRMIVAPKGHPILLVKDISLEEIAKYPIISYGPKYSASWKVMDAFENAGLKPKVAMTGIDADACKTYCALGLGIAILASMAYDPERDTEIVPRTDAEALLPSSMVQIVLRPNTYLRPFLLDFIALVSPRLTSAFVRQTVQSFQRQV